MLKKLFPLALLTALIMSINAYAASTITSVSVTLLPEQTYFEPGDLVGGTAPRTLTSHTEVSSYSISTSNFSPKSSYTVDVTLLAKDGCVFSIPIGVTVKGCSHVEITALSNESITLRCKTYPVYRLLNPSNIEDNGGYAEWTKVTNAAKYNVQIYYLNEEGVQKTASKSTTDTYFDYGDYLSQNDEAYVSVQAVPNTSNTDTKFMCSSEYVFSDSGLTDSSKSPKSFYSFPSVSIKNGKKGSTNNSSTSSSSSSNKRTTTSTTYGYTGNVGPGGPGNSSDGWAGNGEAWVYLKSGKTITSQWVAETDGNWYYMGTNGYMLLGWNLVDGKWYYMNRNSDRKIGSILTGWQLIDNKWYYFEPTHNGYFGALYVSTTTPDGYKVDANGAMIS